jgi:chitin disaccharide deacetylase
MRTGTLAKTLALLALIVGTAAAQQSAKTVQERLGYPADARLLIIHADDLGMDHSVNRATFAALENHWITSSSILVPCPWFPEVARWAKGHRDADLGIHLALNSEWTDFRWGPVSSRDKVPSLLDKQGYFPLLETDVGAMAKPKEAESELRAQIEHARSAGIPISHFDTHMTALMQQKDLLSVYEKLGRDNKVPILLDRSGSRKLPPGGTINPEQALVDSIIEISPDVAPEKWAQWYEQTLSALKPGVYEMIVHLAYDDDEMRGATWDHPDWGAAWRQRDLNMVSSPEFRKFLADQKFVLVTWKELAKAMPNDK